MLRSAEFRNIYDNGVRLSGPLFAAFILARPESGGGARLGLTVPRAVGGAVERNRIKRRLREAFRQRRAGLGDFDIVFNPRRAMLGASADDLRRALDRVMDRVKA